MLDWFSWWDGRLYGPDLVSAIVSGVLTGVFAGLVAWSVAKHEVKTAEKNQEREQQERGAQMIAERRDELRRLIILEFTDACAELQDAIISQPYSKEVSFETKKQESEFSIRFNVALRRAHTRAENLMLMLYPDSNQEALETYKWFRDRWKSIISYSSSNNRELAILNAQVTHLRFVCLRWTGQILAEWSTEGPPQEITERFRVGGAPPQDAE